MECYFHGRHAAPDRDLMFGAQRGIVQRVDSTDSPSFVTTCSNPNEVAVFEINVDRCLAVDVGVCSFQRGSICRLGRVQPAPADNHLRHALEFLNIEIALEFNIDVEIN